MTSSSSPIQPKPSYGVENLKYSDGKIILPNGSKYRIKKLEQTALSKEDIELFKQKFLEKFNEAPDSKNYFAKIKVPQHTYTRISSLFQSSQTVIQEAHRVETKRVTAGRVPLQATPLAAPPPLPQAVFNASVAAAAKPALAPPAKPFKAPTAIEMKKAIDRAMAAKTSRSIRMGYAMSRVFKTTKTLKQQVESVTQAIKQATEKMDELGAKENEINKIKDSLANKLKDLDPQQKKATIDSYIDQKQKLNQEKLETANLLLYLNVQYATLFKNTLDDESVRAKDNIAEIEKALSEIPKERDQWYKAFGVPGFQPPPLRRQASAADLLPKPPTKPLGFLERVGASLGLKKSKPVTNEARLEIQWKIYQEARGYREKFEKQFFSLLDPEIEKLRKSPYSDKEYVELLASYDYLKKLIEFLAPAKDAEVEGLETDPEQRLLFLDQYIETIDKFKSSLNKLLGDENFASFKGEFEVAKALIEAEKKAFTTPPAESEIRRRQAPKKTEKPTPRTEGSWKDYTQLREKRWAQMAAVSDNLGKARAVMERTPTEDEDALNDDARELKEMSATLDKIEAEERGWAQEEDYTRLSPKAIQQRQTEIESLAVRFKKFQDQIEHIQKDPVYADNKSLESSKNYLKVASERLEAEKEAFLQFAGIKVESKPDSGLGLG